jgi:hypothetical protein
MASDAHAKANRAADSKRRWFAMMACLALALVAAWFCWPQDASPGPDVPLDVLVIGSGVRVCQPIFFAYLLPQFAGVTAAHTLVERMGLHHEGQVVVLEASNRVGGRVHTDRSFGAEGGPVELGAAWYVPLCFLCCSRLPPIGSTTQKGTRWRSWQMSLGVVRS